MDEWQLVAVKRDRVPNWLYRVFCFRLPFFGQPSLIQPFRFLLHRELTSAESGQPNQ